MNCFDCKREIEIGDHYIEDSASGFTGQEANSEIDGLIADIFGGAGGKVVFCEDCTQAGGDYKLETFYGDETDVA